MQKVLTDFILQKWQLSQENVLPGDEYSTDEIKIQYKDMKFSLWYRRAEKELYLMGDNSGTGDEKYTRLINEIGVDFNAILKGGQHQELFVEY
jgi:hypothetical protein